MTLADGRNGVEVANTGDSYAQIADLALGSATRPRIVHPGLLGYVLPGQVMRWPIERVAIDRDNDQITPSSMASRNRRHCRPTGSLRP